tara:strand:+ start:4536 stop:4904 length:369 start_codon:yes stop_codon:yes gene_type:complete
MNNQVRLKELSKQVDDGLKVKEMIETEGWKELMEPLLDKMIIDVLGAKEDGRWHNGSLSIIDLGKEEAKALISYKRALTDLHSYVYDIVDTGEQAQTEYNDLIKEDSELSVEYPSDYNTVVT